MPILEPVTDENATAAAKEIIEKLHSKLKMVPNIYRTMAHAPSVLGATLNFAANFKADLDPKLSELAYLKASMINKCGY